MPAQTRASKRKTAILTTPSSPNSEPESNDAEWHGIQNDQPSENEGSEEKECDDEEENNDDEKEEDGDDEDKDDADADQPINPTQARNARAPVWQAWQDCLLITQVNLDCPFLLPRCSRAASWDGTANVLAISSAQQGQSSYFTRSGEACRARFNYLRKKYKADQVRSLQKTGTDEEIDAFMELLDRSGDAGRPGIA
ncbi:hypothetical protein K438DRAFT_78054 [Mycena galopus ATCC 62051]|nr:hypothetical protein K438DRAFT_78054 [Mycena galopus ATCC 62051]